MPSAHHAVINSIKYSKFRVNGAVPKEVWYGASEPKIVNALIGGVWTKVTNKVNYVVGSSTLSCAVSPANQNLFNNYVDSGATYAVYEFTIVLTTTGVQQTLFSYGNNLVYGSATSFYEIYINSANQVVDASRFSSSAIFTHTHGTALAANTRYRIIVSHRGTNPRVVIQIRDVAGATVGTDYSSGDSTSSATYSSSVTTKFLGKRWTTIGLPFLGIFLDVVLYGGQTTSANKNTFNAGWFLSSTAGSTTMTDTATADGSQNFAITGSTISSTE